MGALVIFSEKLFAVFVEYNVFWTQFGKVLPIAVGEVDMIN